MPDRQQKLFQLRNWHGVTRYAVREKEILRPTAKFPYLRLRQVGDSGRIQHGSIHKTISVTVEDEATTGITCCPVGIACADDRAVVNDKGPSLEPPDRVRRITKITNHNGPFSGIARVTC
jgi:hypothetical protein